MQTGPTRHSTAKASTLSVEPCEGGFALSLGGRPVTTGMANHPVIHPRRPLLDHMRDEFLARGDLVIEATRIEEPKFLGAYSLFSVQKEWIEPGKDNLTEDFSSELASDPILHRPPGPEFAEQLAYYGPVSQWLKGMGLRLVDIDLVSLPDSPSEYEYDGEVVAFFGDTLGSGEDTADFTKLSQELQQVFSELAPEERSAAVFLHNIHRSIVHGLALVTGHCTADEYAYGVAAAHAIIPAYADVSKRDHAQATAGYRQEARSALAYIAAYRA